MVAPAPPSVTCAVDDVATTPAVSSSVTVAVMVAAMAMLYSASLLELATLMATSLLSPSSTSSSTAATTTSTGAAQVNAVNVSCAGDTVTPAAALKSSTTSLVGSDESDTPTASVVATSASATDTAVRVKLTPATSSSKIVTRNDAACSMLYMTSGDKAATLTTMAFPSPSSTRSSIAVTVMSTGTLQFAGAICTSAGEIDAPGCDAVSDTVTGASGRDVSTSCAVALPSSASEMSGSTSGDAVTPASSLSMTVTGRMTASC
mmetsp:Transcript_13595/g.47381  ORF Transcript_13595/g.47381 Transcript_13595/m.47381 type:complete len:262 (-) Transcript_13595:1441-2226(-)